LEVALEETGYRVAVAGTPFGEQALANLEKLSELAATHDASGAGGCSAFARELLELAETEPTEAQADLLDAQDPRAVSLLTIHQSKGLEWPIVFVPDLGAQRMNDSSRVVFDRREGLALRPWFADPGITSRSPRFLGVVSERRAREEAEYRRTLYVALTRARDRLVLSGGSPDSSQGSWWQLLDSAITGDSGLGALVCDLPVDELPSGALLSLPVVASDGDRVRVERAVQRVRTPVVLRPRRGVLPVTQLQDYLRCPRRYLYAHLVGLSERPQIVELDSEEEQPQERPAHHSRLRGSVAHRLLERVPLESLGTKQLKATLEKLAAEEGIECSSPEGREILSWVEGFADTRFAARLRTAGVSRVHRELPFLLRLDREGFSAHLKGQIDLIFEDDDQAAVVVDYKASRRPPTGLEPYRFQLDCYALAARHLVAEGVPLRVGIAFLREPSAEPELRDVAPDEILDFERHLAEQAQELCDRPVSGEWPGRLVTECEAMGCGYRYRCHPVRGL
jgi:ATP-dependent exoDNAse (exonuclease V) beta subunit